jgi:hypothetical protein
LGISNKHGGIMALRCGNKINREQQQAINELLELVSNHNSKGATALDSANRAGISLTFTEQQQLRKQTPVGKDAAIEPDLSGGYPNAIANIQARGRATSNRDQRLQPSSFDGFYRHPEQPAFASDGMEEEQQAHGGAKPEASDNDIASLVAALNEVPAGVSKTAAQASTRSESGVLQVGQAEYNARHGKQVASYS